MKRVLLDTNIYGEIAIDPKLELLREKLLLKEKAVFYGLDVVRRELRATPKGERIGGKSLRMLLLNLYDTIVKRELVVTREVEETAGSYFEAYAKLGGRKPREGIIKDFLIVAAASIHGLDVVVSNDKSSMLSEEARKAYMLVNGIKKIPHSAFLLYKDFRRWFV